MRNTAFRSKKVHDSMKRAAKLTTMAMKPKKKSSKLSESKNDIVNSNGSSSISKPLLSLAQLYQGVVVRRPSLHNKSPYVADVTLDEGFKYSTVKFKNVAHLLKVEFFKKMTM